jgi:hypothetical protein
LRYEFATAPPRRLTIACVHDRFEADGTVHEVHKQRSGRPCSATSPASSAVVLEQFTRSPLKSTKQYALETQCSGSGVQRILKHAKLKVCTLSLLHATNEDDSDRRLQFCESFQRRVHEDEEFVSKTVWSDVATFNLNGTLSHHDYVYWAAESPPFMWIKQSIYQDSLSGVNCRTGV